MTTYYTKDYKEQETLSFLFNALKFTCTEGSRIFYLYGGAPRDLLRGEEPRDYDLFIKDERNINNFVSFLNYANRLKKESRNFTECVEYKFLSLELELNQKTVLVDVTNETTQSETSVFTCDFACNNLVITKDGIGTRLNCPESLDLSPPLWLIYCVQDCLNGRLSWMISDNLFKNIGAQRYVTVRHTLHKRLQKMKEKGFKNESFLTNFQNKEFEVTVFKEDDTCIICKEGYTSSAGTESAVEKTKAILLDCGHHFHVDCLNEWIIQGRYHSTCPLCRKSILWV